MHVKHEYPKWKYHAVKEAVIVKDEAEELALGVEWASSPAHFAKENKKVEEEKVDPPQEKKRRGRAPKSLGSDGDAE